MHELHFKQCAKVQFCGTQRVFSFNAALKSREIKGMHLIARYLNYLHFVYKI